MATHTTHTIDVATDRDFPPASPNSPKRRRMSWKTQTMASGLLNDTATTSTTNHHAALMHGHDHEGLSERTRHTHGDSAAQDIDERKSKQIGKMITPYLAQHIPQQYNPQGADSVGHDAPRSTADTKYCYRHRPDLLCRRQADEPSMQELQDVCLHASNRSTFTD
jgi:F-box/WD-40 domain protein MET30